MLNKLKLLVLIFALTGLTHGARAADEDLSSVVRKAGVDPQSSTLIIRRLSDNKIWTSNPDRASKQFPPASTSKIPHTLIALETGWAKPSTSFAWNGKVTAIAAWNQDQTLQSAYKRSAVWVYQKMAASLGHKTMGDWISKLGYGNHNVGSAKNVTTYWLLGPLEISAREQVDFLARLIQGKLPFSSSTIKDGRKIMLADSGNNWKMFAKTGWRHDRVNTDIGWYVGWVERRQDNADETYVFALNLDMVAKRDRRARIATVRRALVSINALPAGTK